MGWGSGSQVMNDIIHGMLDNNETVQCRARMYRVIIPSLEDQDWDTQSDSMEIDPVFDVIIRSLHPDWEGGG